MIAAAGDRKKDILKIIVDLARSKLLCQNQIDVRHSDLRHKPGATAVVDLRLMFEYETRREVARSAEAELVAAHMRLAYSIPQTRESVRSGYSSEPVLAEAAAQQMRVFRSHDPNAILDILCENTKSGLLDRGERGELVARELLTSAYDRAVEREFNDLVTEDSSASTSLRIPFYSRGVSLITFIEELFAPPFVESILDSVPNNVPSGIKFRKAFEEAKIRFTHFGRMGDDTGTTTAAVRAALIRGMAIITRVGEILIDLIIPIVLKSSELLKKEVITGILVSVKRRRAKGAVARYEIDETVLGFFPHSKDPFQPYISLVMELGVERTPSPERVAHVKVKGKKAAPTTPKRKRKIKDMSTSYTTPSTVRIPGPGKHHHLNPQHPRYSIFAYGCSNTVYKGITAEQRPLYRILLASKSIMEEHPRKGESIHLIQRLKPCWIAGKDCYHWLQDDWLRKEAVPTFPDDEVVVDEPQIIDDESFQAAAEDEDVVMEPGPGEPTGLFNQCCV
jgi:hypothetical protein